MSLAQLITGTIVGVIAVSGVAAAATGGNSEQVVLRVVDGDTVVMDDGSEVRLIGIDAPEMTTECGPAAKRALAGLVEGQTVTLDTSSGKGDTDHYGRALRYIDVAGTDAGHTLIEQGHAIARYDSADQWGPHDREDAYRAASRDNDCIVTSLSDIDEVAQQGQLHADDPALDEESWQDFQDRQAFVQTSIRKHEAAQVEAARQAEQERQAELARQAAAQRQAEEREQERIAAVQARQRELEQHAEREQVAAAPAQRQESQSNNSSSSSTSFTPPPGWTTDAHTPGYTGCRQGYPGGKISGVYVWKPIPC